MRCHIVLMTLVVLFGITVFFCLDTQRPKGKDPSFESSWSFATSRDPIVTNRMGRVIQPVIADYHLGGDRVDVGKKALAMRYEDLRMVACDRVEYMLVDFRRDWLCARFLADNNDYDVSSVSNAFASMHYKVIEDGPIPVLKIMVSANRRELADAVMSFWTKTYCDMASESEQWRVDVALKNINCQIKKLKEKRLPTTDKERELSEDRRRAESQMVKTYTLSGG